MPCPPREGEAEKPHRRRVAEPQPKKAKNHYDDDVPVLDTDQQPQPISALVEPEELFFESVSREEWESMPEDQKRRVRSERERLQHQLLHRLGNVVATSDDPDFAKVWAGESHSVTDLVGWGRTELDKARILDEFSQQELDYLVKRGWISDRSMRQNDEGQFEKVYALALPAKRARLFQLLDFTELNPPRTMGQMRRLADLLTVDDSGPVYDAIVDYLGIRPTMEKWRAENISFVQWRTRARDLLYQMVYRHYNPLPVWERARTPEVSARVEKLKGVGDAVRSDPEVKALMQEIVVLEDQHTALMQQVGDVLETKPVDRGRVEELKARASALMARVKPLWAKRAEIRDRITASMLVDILKVPDPVEVKVDVPDFGDGYVVQVGPTSYMKVDEAGYGHIVEDRREATRFPDKDAAEKLRQESGGVVSTSLHPEERAAVDSAARWLAGKVSGAGSELPPYTVIRDDLPTTGRPGPSAYYRQSAHGINVPTGMKHEGTNVHEMGHGIEYRLPGVQRAAQLFLAHRVKDEPKRFLKEVLPDSGYGAGEQGRKDDFTKVFGSNGWYVGKDYPDGGTEVISMGIEKLHDDPVGFARDDPEYCGFILSILDGSGREKRVPD